MTQVIYVDILFTVNLIIGYCLLILTGTVCKSEINRLRVLLSSALQGAYSLVILLPVLPFYLNIAAKSAACAVFTFTAFRIRTKKQFFRLYFAFLFISFCFAGVMLFICIISGTDRLAYKNTAVYFSVDLKVLVISTVVCYAVSRIIYEFLRRKAPSCAFYTLTVHAFKKELTCDAMLDTGNSLTDAFSCLPVIVFDIKKIAAMLPDGFDIKNENTYSLLPGFRLIPYGTLNGNSFMPAFRPDTVTVKNLSGKTVTSDVIIGLCDRRIAGGSVGALLNTQMLEERSFYKNDTIENNKQTV
ncbi:MAG: sigma-E processing peptidase SpoIIGA [Clostridia bacterium]|nr:sigma-E processing peptidase SpoIIGA [Clostridia bacterium]